MQGFRLIFLYRLWPNVPVIANKGGEIPNANVDVNQAIEVVRNSDIYNQFDKWHRIERIFAKRLNPTEDKARIDYVNKKISKVIDYDIYQISVSTNGMCIGTSQIDFYVDPVDGKILKTEEWIIC